MAACCDWNTSLNQELKLGVFVGVLITGYMWGRMPTLIMKMTLKMIYDSENDLWWTWPFSHAIKKLTPFYILGAKEKAKERKSSQEK